MPPIQTFKTPRGEELVILSRTDYDALINAAADVAEDRSDAEIHARRKMALANGQDAPLPADVSRAISKGSNRLKAIRTWRGKSQVKVAAHLGISQGHLSDVETGRRAVTSDIVQKLADFYNVPESWLS